MLKLISFIRNFVTFNCSTLNFYSNSKSYHYNLYVAVQNKVKVKTGATPKPAAETPRPTGTSKYSSMFITIILTFPGVSLAMC